MPFVNGAVELEWPIRSHSKAELSPASTRRNSGGLVPCLNGPEEGQRTEQNCGGSGAVERERNRGEGDAICDANDGDGMTFANGIAVGQQVDQNGEGGRDRGAFENGMVETTLNRLRTYPRTGTHARRRSGSHDSMDDDKRQRCLVADHLE